MVDGEATIEGRRWRYSVSDNLDASTWAVNVHGFMAGGGIYWRESARLAGKLGLRVINPNLPGFSGSDPLPWEELRMGSFARGLAGLLDHLGASSALLLGHSMGGAVAMQFAHDGATRLVYLGSGDVLTYDPVLTDLERVERKLLALWEAIRQATESGDWRPRPTKLCGWCDHQAHCPEFGGTPPPYPLPLRTPQMRPRRREAREEGAKVRS